VIRTKIWDLFADELPPADLGLPLHHGCGEAWKAHSEALEWELRERGEREEVGGKKLRSCLPGTRSNRSFFSHPPPRPLKKRRKTRGRLSQYIPWCAVHLLGTGQGGGQREVCNEPRSSGLRPGNGKCVHRNDLHR